MTLDTAYLSAVMVANALKQANHKKAPEALALKDALAKAVTHPETIRSDDFQKAWNARTQFATITLKGELGDLVAKHGNILTQITLSKNA